MNRRLTRTAGVAGAAGALCLAFAGAAQAVVPNPLGDLSEPLAPVNGLTSQASPLGGLPADDPLKAATEPSRLTAPLSDSAALQRKLAGQLDSVAGDAGSLADQAGIGPLGEPDPQVKQPAPIRGDVDSAKPELGGMASDLVGSRPLGDGGVGGLTGDLTDPSGPPLADSVPGVSDLPLPNRPF